MPILVFIPGMAVILFIGFEMPKKVKTKFFKIPIWLSSTAIATIIGVIGRGVLGPSTGFMSELVLFPGLYVIKNKEKFKKKFKKKFKLIHKRGEK